MLARHVVVSHVHRYQGEFFELLSPVQTTHYSEVGWTQLSQPLPATIVQRFDGKVIAITGYEADIVRVDAQGNITSVPCFEQYNHHYSGFMVGKLAAPSGPVLAADGKSVVMGGHGEPLQGWDVGASAFVGGVEIPSTQAFSEGNGNEHRGSWHGYPACVFALRVCVCVRVCVRVWVGGWVGAYVRVRGRVTLRACVSRHSHVTAGCESGLPFNCLPKNHTNNAHVPPPPPRHHRRDPSMHDVCVRLNQPPPPQQQQQQQRRRRR